MQESVCRYCGRRIVLTAAGLWIDPEATGDDAIWREVCGSHDTFTAEHEPGQEHTPGPWKVLPGTSDGELLIGTDDWLIVGMYPGIGVDTDTDLANARLIAAAPGLLEAAQQVLERLDRWPVPSDGWPAQDALRAAIAKATGQEASL